MPRSARFLRGVIDGPMAKEVGTETGCGRTATAYLSKPPFLAALAVEDEEEVTAILLSSEGQELWRARGAATPDVLAALRARLPSASPGQSERAAEAPAP